MAEALERLLVGRKLAGRYEIQEVIGRGGMSVVYRGVDQTLGRPVAVKIISFPDVTDEMRQNLRERFRREAGSAARIPHHPNVVQIYDYGTDPELDLDFIVMELLVGRDLKEALATRLSDPEESVRILREAARGLAAGHRVGIVHRDVKPANVFLAGSERFESVRILDFGIAKPLTREPGEDLTLAGQLPHSPAYASPEQVNPDLPVTTASDVYQLGLIGYELLAGARPFNDEDRARIRAGEAVAPRPGPRWDSVPAPLRETILRALRPRPEERYADAAEFAEAISAAVGEERTLAAAPTPPLPDEDATVAAPPPISPPGVEAPPQTSPPAPRTTAAPARPVRTGGGGARAAAIAGGVLLLGALAWGLTRGGGDEGEEVPAATQPADTGGPAREFEGLEAEAAREQMKDRERGEAPAAPASGGRGGERVGRDEEAERTAAAEVQRVILELNDSWVNGDLERHLSHYADRVDFYDDADAPRSRIRSEREGDLRNFNQDRRIRVTRQAVTFPEPDRAVALVDKEWTFVGDRLRRTGAGRQEIVLERRGGRWIVVSEKMREVFRSSQEGS
ncbi:MAG TPA: protein kinase [Longimicrobiaceae bacterium]|nr:protein kinase [Longimicrobiaceae bacterium]